MKTFKCVCWEKEHKVGEESPQGQMLTSLIETMGKDIKVLSMLSGKAYMVPRIYIAVHGLRGDKLDFIAIDYKFKEVK